MKVNFIIIRKRKTSTDNIKKKKQKQNERNNLAVCMYVRFLIGIGEKKLVCKNFLNFFPCSFHLIVFQIKTLFKNEMVKY